MQIDALFVLTSLVPVANGTDTDRTDSLMQWSQEREWGRGAKGDHPRLICGGAGVARDHRDGAGLFDGHPVHFQAFLQSLLAPLQQAQWAWHPWCVGYNPGVGHPPHPDGGIGRLRSCHHISAGEAKHLIFQRKSGPPLNALLIDKDGIEVSPCREQDRSFLRMDYKEQA